MRQDGAEGLKAARSADRSLRAAQGPSWHTSRWLPWNELIKRAKRRIDIGYTMKPVYVGPCRMVITFTAGGNGAITLRCECMAGTVNAPRARYYNYDTLGEGLTWPEAQALWEVHRASKGDDHGEARSTA